MMRYFSMGWRHRYLFSAVALVIFLLGTLAVLSLKRSISFTSIASIRMSRSKMLPER